jgi:hypothetical protein
MAKDLIAVDSGNDVFAGAIDFEWDFYHFCVTVGYAFGTRSSVLLFPDVPAERMHHCVSLVHVM